MELLNALSRDNNVIIEVFFADMYVDKVAQIPAYDFWNLLGTLVINWKMSFSYIMLQVTLDYI